MKCRDYEKWIHRSFDNLLEDGESEILERHLKSCPVCHRKREEYSTILGILREEEPSETKPYFWERLQAKIKDREKLALWPAVKRWSFRAVPLSLLLVLLIALAVVFLSTPKEQEMSSSEALLLRNLNPLQESQILLEGGLEAQNMMIIFSSLEEENIPRRKFP